MQHTHINNNHHKPTHGLSSQRCMDIKKSCHRIACNHDTGIIWGIPLICISTIINTNQCNIHINNNQYKTHGLLSQDMYMYVYGQRSIWEDRPLIWTILPFKHHGHASYLHGHALYVHSLAPSQVTHSIHKQELHIIIMVALHSLVKGYGMIFQIILTFAHLYLVLKMPCTNI